MDISKLSGLHTLTFKFPGDSINTVHQNGEALTQTSRGVEYHIHFRDEIPACCEMISISGDDEHAEIGIEIDGNTFTGYDGVFECPARLIAIMEQLGYKNGLED